MAHLDVTAIALDQTEEVVLVVSVVDDDGLPRAALPAGAFAVHQLAGIPGAAWQRTVAAASEGPAGVYQLQLAPLAESPAPPGSAVLAVVVAGPTEGGWAAEQGQTLALLPAR